MFILQRIAGVLEIGHGFFYLSGEALCYAGAASDPV